MIIGLLTDVFDGIIARKLKISTERLRILDSNVDQFFWIVVIASVFYSNWVFIKSNYFSILLIFALEMLAYILSYIKFKKTLATHSIFAKIWTLSLLAFLIDLSLSGNCFFFFYLCIALGVLSRIEIIIIIIALKKWQTDVPSILVVGKINRGEPFKKSILFNS